MKEGGGRVGGRVSGNGEDNANGLEVFWCLWLPLGRAAKLLSGRQCHVDVFIVCQWQLLLTSPTSPPALPPPTTTGVSELQLTHLSRIRSVGCACESFGGCSSPKRETERGGG